VTVIIAFFYYLTISSVWNSCGFAGSYYWS